MVAEADRDRTRLAGENLDSTSQREGEVKGVGVADGDILGKFQESAIDSKDGLKPMPAAKIEIESYGFETETIDCPPARVPARKSLSRGIKYRFRYHDWAAAANESDRRTTRGELWSIADDHRL